MAQYQLYIDKSGVIVVDASSPEEAYQKAINLSDEEFEAAISSETDWDICNNAELCNDAEFL